MWLHLGASRCDLWEVANDVGRTRSGGDVMFVALVNDLGLEGESYGEVVVGLRTGLELEGDVDGVVDGCSEERVVRFVSFVGDSVGGGKSLGWLRVATIMRSSLRIIYLTEVRNAIRGSVKS